ncbi:MAG: peroxiredoxin family protein [Planctomycetota bacterium]|jgi:peroxiredoxin|nr:peroxiredoxin family protein [Planctomycetota bacterium]
MSKQDKRRCCGAAVTILSVVLVAAVIWMGCKKHPDQPTQTERHPEELQSEPIAKNIAEPVKTDTNAPAGPKVSLYSVVKAARTWRPVYTSLYHKPAPDFTLTDTAGKEHKLSDYRGKDVLLIFWATWCRPCQMEVPGLVELRRTISEDKLAMLAISSDKPDVAKRFVADQEINYTVLLDKGNMPEPFGVMRIYSRTGVPCSFFIGPDGKIKLATSGLLSLGDIRAILQAE